MNASEDSELPFVEAAAGDKAAADALFASLYDDLKEVAERQIWGKQRNLTLGPTAAVNVLYEKWVKGGRITATNRAEFFLAAAVAIQRIVIDYRRWKATRERDRVPGEPDELVPADPDGDGDGDDSDVDPEAVRLALDALRPESPRQYRAAMMRYYDGLEVQAIAEILALSTKQVQRDLRAAEAFVQAYLARRDRGRT